jgi:multicomponent K+:H+ antiporter subunit A
VWHGFTAPLLMCALAIGGGYALYFGLFLRVEPGSGRLWQVMAQLDGRRLFDAFFVAMTVRGARALEGLLGSDRLQPQLRLILALVIAVACVPALTHGFAFPAPGAGIDWGLALVWTVGASCALGAAWSAKFHRLAALLLSGGAGLATCLTFLWFSAPDLALTQLLVEIVIGVLLLLGLRWLPPRKPATPTRAAFVAALPRRLLDLAIAVAAGFGVFALAYAVMTRPAPKSIADFFVVNAWPQGGGTNVVNVILVDFRGFDTLGEITVLTAAAVAVYSLLRRFRPAPESLSLPPQQRRHDARALASDMLLPAVMMRALLAPIAVLAVYFLFRGHNLPGGGFVAGLTMAAAIILQYMALGTHYVESRVPVRPVRLMGLGLVIAGGTGAGSWLFAHPFLTSHVLKLHVPFIGELHVPTALAFDLGVFGVVFGCTVLVLIALAHQSLRAHRAAEERK